MFPVPSKDLGMSCTASSSMRTMGDLAAKGREQKSYQPSSAQLTNSLRAAYR